MTTPAPSSDLIAEFVAFTGVEDTAKAVQMLEATNNDIQAAVELYFAADAAGGLGTNPANPANPGNTGAGPDPFSADGFDAFDDEPVRAPIPTRVDRLLGSPDFDTHGSRHRPRRSQPIDSHQPIMDAFRARREEGMVGGGSGGFGAGIGASGVPSVPSAPGAPNHGKDSHWSDQFSPPMDLLFKDGDCQDAAEFAQRSKQWLLVNIQSPSSFDSHRLNRDTWKDPTMGAMLPVSFVFYQAYDVSEEGQMLASMWGCYSFPVTIVVDPVTQAVMRTWYGFVPADELIEELVPFMDTSFDDPGASRLAAASFRKKSKAMGVNLNDPEGPTSDRHHHQHSRRTSDPPVVVPGLEDQSDRSSPGQPQSSVLERQPSSLPTTAPTTRQPSMLEEPDDESNRVVAGVVQEEAKAALPDEPGADDPGTCRIAVRLPDGTRAQRRFPFDVSLSVLRTWCISLSLEAAGGREFALAEAVPGAAAIDLDEPGKTVGGAGMSGVMLGMKWTD